MSNDEKNFIKNNWINKSSLYKNQIAGKISNEGLKSNFTQIKLHFIDNMTINDSIPLSSDLFKF